MELSKWKLLSWTLVCLVLLGGIGIAIAMRHSNREVVLRNGDTELHVPRRYLLESANPWTRSLSGLDDGSRSASIVIGVEETRTLLPKRRLSVNGKPRALFATISIMRPEEAGRLPARKRNLAEQIRSHSGEFSKFTLREEPLIQGWRIYPGESEDRNRWFLLLNKPSGLLANDVLGQCYSSEPGEFETCHLNIPIDDVLVETNVDLQDLTSLAEIQSYFERLVTGWRKSDE
jgi:hypothetical protein